MEPTPSTRRCAICREPFAPLARAYQVMPVEVGAPHLYDRLDAPLLLCAGCLAEDLIDDLLRERCPAGSRHTPTRHEGGMGRSDWYSCSGCGLELA
jgi:hypothetical protein